MTEAAANRQTAWGSYIVRAAPGGRQRAPSLGAPFVDFSALSLADRRELRAILVGVVAHGWEYDDQWDDTTAGRSPCS